MIETFEVMNNDVVAFYGSDKKFSELTLTDFENLKEEYNLEMRFERDSNILQHSFNLIYDNGLFNIDPSFDQWWKEISTIIKVNIYDKISNDYFLYIFIIIKNLLYILYMYIYYNYFFF